MGFFMIIVKCFLLPLFSPDQRYLIYSSWSEYSELLSSYFAYFPKQAILLVFG